MKQGESKPLFPELEWSRPENKQQAGKLLIVGGNLHGFAAPAEAYAEAQKAGIGAARVLVPASLQRIVGAVMPNVEFAPSTPSGSFNQKALAEVLAHGQWADAVLVAGDLGRNSETAILIEKLLSKYPGRVTFTKDAVDYAISSTQPLLQREKTLLVLSLAQLRRLGAAAKFTRPITYGMDLLHLVQWLHEFTLEHKPHILVKHLDNIFLGADGKVSTTKLKEDQQIWRVKTAGKASVWWLQHPGKPFEALTAAIYAASTP